MNEKFSVIDGYKNCSKCKEKMPIDRFHLDKSVKSGLSSECKKHSKDRYEKVRSPLLRKIRSKDKVWDDLEIEQLKKGLIDNLKIREISTLIKIDQQEIKKKIRELNLRIGIKINKLTIIEEIGKFDFKCRCECGREVVIGKNRFSGKEMIKSCGCHKKLTFKLISLKNLSPQLYSFRYLFSRYARGAENRELKFDLDFDFFIILIKKDCVYCGIKARPYNCWKGRSTSKTKEQIAQFQIEANGVDRIDNQKGYTEENSVTCCKECNYAKRDMSNEEWLAYLNRIFEFKNKK